MIWDAIALDCAQVTAEPMRVISGAHQSNTPPVGHTFYVPPRTWDFGHAGSAQVSMIIRPPNGLAEFIFTRRGVSVRIAVGMTMLNQAQGPRWHWVVKGKRKRKVWLMPHRDTLVTHQPRQTRFIRPLDAAHVALVDLYRLFGLVWTGDQSLPAKPYRMTIARYAKLIGKIREQWDVLSGR